MDIPNHRELAWRQLNGLRSAGTWLAGGRGCCGSSSFWLVWGESCFEDLSNPLIWAKNNIKPYSFSSIHTQLRNLALMLTRAFRSGNAIHSAGLIILSVISFLLFFGARAPDQILIIVASDQISVIFSGLLAASFVGQEVVVPLVRPFAKMLSAADESLENIGHTSAYIGWIERTLVFAFAAGGQPAAAALAITAKTLVRIPDLDKHPEGFVEYVLIETLASFLVALIFAVAVRTALGLPPM